MKKAIRILKKLLIIVMIILVLNNFVTIPVVRAADAIGEAVTGFFVSFLGLLTFPVRAIALGIAKGVNALSALVAYIEGATDPSIKTTTITPFDIFFNKVKILDVNFFEIGNDVNIVNTIRTGIAAWYYALRLIAMAILLVILIYVGIRMAISTIATDKAMYKRMLFDWAVSLVLIFLINYIIIFVITLNNIVVDAIGKNINAAEISNVYDTIGNLAFDVFDIDSIPATVIYSMLVIQTLGLIITYFNRMLKIAFLIIISPLITLTYAVDKMGDGKAQALGNWIREFVFTVITQIFHCIIYMSMINVSFNILIAHSSQGIRTSLATAVMAILCVNFVKTAENLVRKILMHNHQDSSVSVAGGMAATAIALQKSKSLGKATRTAVNVTKGNLEAAGRALGRVGKVAGGAVGTAAKVPVAAGKKLATTYQTHKEMKNFLSENEEGKKIKEGIKKPDNYRQASKEERAKINKERQKYKVAKKEKRAEIKAAKKAKVDGAVANAGRRIGAAGKKVGRTITAPVGKVKEIKHKLNRIASQSSSYQVVSSIAKAYTAAGVGFATGSMMYGATGKAGQAVGMGLAGYNMHREFQKSALTMENSTQSSLIGMGIKTKEEAFKVLDDVARNSVLYDGESPESLAQAEAILKNVGEKLKEAVGNPDLKTSIKNQIDTAVKKNPEALPDIVNNFVNKKKQDAMPDGLSENGKQEFNKKFDEIGLREACQAYADFASKKEIHSQMKNAQGMGITKDSYVQECTEGFVERSDTAKPKNVNGEKELDKIISKSEDSEKMTERVMSMPTEAVDAVSDALEARRQFIEDAIKNANDNERQSFEAQLKELEKIESAMADAIIRDKDKALRESQKAILEQVKKDSQKEIDKLRDEVMAQLSNEDPKQKKEIDRLRDELIVQVSSEDVKKKEQEIDRKIAGYIGTKTRIERPIKQRKVLDSYNKVQSINNRLSGEN